MTKLLLSFLVVLSSCASIRTYHRPKDSEKWETPVEEYFASSRSAMKDLRKKTVKIGYSCGFKVGDSGTGVVIQKSNRRTLVATAKHVVDWMVERNCDIVVTDWRGFSGFAKVNDWDFGTDVALIEIRESLGKPAKLFDDPFGGQAIMCVGFPVIPLYPDENKISYAEGIVMTTGVKGFLRVSADIYLGNSGGSCFSEDGQVVGIVSHLTVAERNDWDQIVPFPGQYFISDVKNVKNLLDS